MVEHAVAATELVSNTGRTFVSIRNASATVNRACNAVPPCPIKGRFCVPVSIPANKATLLGLFSLAEYGEIITLAFPDITDLYIDTAESDFVLTGVAEPEVTLDW